MVGRAAWAGCLLLPLTLLHARALAEILIAGIDLLFLVHVVLARDGAWLRQPFARAAGVWWLWLVLCSLLAGGGLLMGLAAVRLPLLAVAVEWLLRPQARRRWLWVLLTAAFVWIGLESWQQTLTGHNLFGQGRWPDGSLTGPFNKPRAGPAFILLFFPVVVPAGMALLAGRARAKAWGLVAIALAVLTMLLIGQRMPSVLMLLGLAVSALLLPGLRPSGLAACLAGVVLLVALPVISPATNAKLVVTFAGQMRHFAASDYGLIFTRAAGLARQHPVIGTGFDGFRHDCSATLATYRTTRPPPRIVHGCNIHPHNYYLEAADNAGLPGLLTFIAMVAAALVTLARRLWQHPDPLRVGLFAGALVALWPVASTSAFTSMPNGGWVFLLLGLGFAVSSDTRAETRSHDARLPEGER